MFGRRPARHAAVEAALCGFVMDCASGTLSMIPTRRAALAQSGYRFSLATNAERVCAEIMPKGGEQR
ncbi:hypothetical protein LMTR3_34470 [Bradyrhizobium sp. LMTR 3]|nr:hypothetical protein LMTR3_34470 [Bradyrhizobium sp. LMTR 3]